MGHPVLKQNFVEAVIKTACVEIKKCFWTVVYIANFGYFFMHYRALKYNAFIVEHPVYFTIRNNYNYKCLKNVFLASFEKADKTVEDILNTENSDSVASVKSAIVRKEASTKLPISGRFPENSNSDDRNSDSSDTGMSQNKKQFAIDRMGKKRRYSDSTSSSGKSEVAIKKKSALTGLKPMKNLDSGRNVKHFERQLESTILTEINTADESNSYITIAHSHNVNNDSVQSTLRKY